MAGAARERRRDGEGRTAVRVKGGDSVWGVLGLNERAIEHPGDTWSELGATTTAGEARSRWSTASRGGAEEVHGAGALREGRARVSAPSS